MRDRAWSITISVWIHTSPSGCHSCSCSHPMSAAISGQSRWRTRSSRARVKPSDGRRARRSSFCSSPQTRSAGRSSSGMPARSVRVSSGTVSSNRAANCSARSTRRLSSAKVFGSITRSTPASRSARPPKGSSYAPVSGSQAIALIVKSRRRAASRSGIDGSPSTAKAVCPRPDFDSRRGSATSMPATLYTGKLRPTGSTRPNGPEQRGQVGLGDAVDLEVHILRCLAAQPIAHPAADDQRTAAAGGRRLARWRAESPGPRSHQESDISSRFQSAGSRPRTSACHTAAVRRLRRAHPGVRSRPRHHPRGGPVCIERVADTRAGATRDCRWRRRTCRTSSSSRSRARTRKPISRSMAAGSSSSRRPGAAAAIRSTRSTWTAPPSRG